MSDCVLDWMKKHLPPEKWTRKNYLQLNWFGDPPAEPLDAELEAEIPIDELIDDRVIDINTRKPHEE